MIDLPLLTERLSVRRMEPGDLERFLSFMLDEPSTRYLMFSPEQKTAAGARELFQAVIESYDSAEPVHAFAIADRQTGEYLGSCGHSPYDESVVECYYSVNAEYRGRGIATEAVRALVERLAESFEVRAYCHPENMAAHAVAMRCGMQPRGLARHKHFGNEGSLFVLPNVSASAGAAT